jgi:hypothetical protein
MPLTATVLPSEGSHFMLGLKRAASLERFHLHVRSSEPASLKEATDWLFQELAGQDAEAGPQGNRRRPTRPSRLRGLELRLPISFITDIQAPKISTLSEMLSDETNFPLLEEVDIKFTRSSSLWACNEKFERKQEEEMEAAMYSLKKRGVLRVAWMMISSQ